jgi:hypothetical protein
VALVHQIHYLVLLLHTQAVAAVELAVVELRVLADQAAAALAVQILQMVRQVQQIWAAVVAEAVALAA